MDETTPRTLIEPIVDKAAARPDEICFYAETEQGWRPYTHKQFLDDVKALAVALAARGIQSGDRVGILGPPTYEWVLADKAIMWLGATSVGLDSKATAKDLAYIMDKAELKGLFVESPQTLEGVPENARPDLTCIFGSESTGTLTTLDILMQEGKGKTPPEHRAEAQGVASIIFTSGTTGRPKGIPLRHHQLAAGYPWMNEFFQGETGHRTLSWVPLHNITGRMMEANNYFMDVVQYFLRDPHTLIDRTRELHPTYLVVLPRILEKVYQGVQSKLSEQSSLAKAGFSLLRHTRRRVPALASLADRLMLSKVRTAVWGKSLKFLISGSAPVDSRILEFFDSLGIPTLEVYGMSEVGFLLAMNRPRRMRYGSVGEALPNVEIKLADDGEVLAKTPAALEGYLGDSDTSELFDEDGYLKTGDLGEFRDGYLYLVGRKKEIIKTSTGLRIPPTMVEAAYKSTPGVDNVVAIGDQRKYITALVSLESDFQCALEAQGDDPNQYVEREFAQRHQELPKAYQCKKFTLLPEPLSIEAGEITPTLKLKRAAIQERYQSLVERMYED